MTKKLFLYVGVYFFVLLLLLITVFFYDVKNNGLSLTNAYTNSSNFSIDGKTNIIHFKANTNYLGTVSLPIVVSEKTHILFRIKEEHANNWYQVATYSGKFVANLSPFPFGFGVIHDSSQKNYIVEIKSITPGQKAILQSKTLYSKYVFNKSLLMHDRHLAITYLLNKLLFLISSFYLWFGALGISLVIIFFRSSLEINSLFPIINKLDLGNNWLVYLVILYFLTSLNLFLLFPSVMYLYLVIFRRMKSTSHFLIPIVVLGEIVVLLFIHRSTDVVTLLPAFIIFFMAGIIQELITTVFPNELVENWYKKTRKVIFEYPRQILFILLGCIFISILIFSTFNRTYYLGGDDSRLYFLYPKEYFINLVSKVGPDTASGELVTWLPPISIAPFVLLFVILKMLLPFVNIQAFAYIANILGGFVAFYLLLGYLIPTKEKIFIAIKVLGSLLYVFSIFDFYTLFNSQLIANFLLSTFPLSIYLYIRGIREKKVYFIVLIALVWSLFAYFTSALPWFAGAVLTLLPLLLFELRQQIKRSILYIAILGTLILLLNAFWLTTLSYSQVVNSSGKQNNASITSTSFREKNAKGIQIVSGTNSVFYPLVNLYQYDIQNNFKWSFIPLFTSWYLPLLPFNVLFLLLVLYAGKIVKVTDPNKKIYVTGVLSFVIALYLYTVNIGKWGIPIFVSLNNYIPGFVMFRNMYDKFGFAIACALAVAFTVSLSLVVKNIRSHIKRFLLLTVCFVIILLNAKPFLTGEFANVPIWTTRHTINRLTAFNRDFVHLTSFIKQQNSVGRYLWVPLDAGNSVQVQDNMNVDDYYNGVSPLLSLTGKNDYSGLSSFGKFSDEIKNYLYSRNYEKAGYFYQRFNVKYIIVDNSRSDEFRTGYLCGDGLCDVQNKEYVKTIVGRKVKDFGKRYSLYIINDQFSNQRIYATNDIKKFSQDADAHATFQKLSNTHYTVTLRHIKNTFALVLLSPYYTNWEIRTADTKKIIMQGSHNAPFGYANGWVLQLSDLKKKLPEGSYIQNSDGTITAILSLYFDLGWTYPIGLSISILTALIAILYVGYMIRRDIRQKNK